MSVKIVASDRSKDFVSKQVLITKPKTPTIETLGIREQYRDQYWQRRDPICEDRLLWRAQTFRHMVL
jgi:hypothetical protein